MSTTPGAQAELTIGQTKTSADQLALTWQLHPATVVGVLETDPAQTRVRLDGDTTAAAALPAVSMVGLLSVDARVFVLRIPPAGLYVVGHVAHPAPQSMADTQDTSGTTTSVGYTETLTGGTACSTPFTAPATGRVLIGSNARVQNSGANASYVSFIVREGAVVGSGATVLGAADARAILHEGTTFERDGITYLLEGLTPGAAYNIRQAFRVVAGTGAFANKHLLVVAA